VLPLLVRLRDMALAGGRCCCRSRSGPSAHLRRVGEAGAGVGLREDHAGARRERLRRLRRHHERIEIINILNPDGTLNENAGAYAGLDRYVARDRVVADLTARGLLGPIEDRDVEVGHSDRSKTAVEPYLSDQWYVTMGDVPGGIAMGRGTPKAHAAPASSRRRWTPRRTGGSLPPGALRQDLPRLAHREADWPISRQLWWGHRIPVWRRRAPSARSTWPGSDRPVRGRPEGRRPHPRPRRRHLGAPERRRLAGRPGAGDQ